MGRPRIRRRAPRADGGPRGADSAPERPRTDRTDSVPGGRRATTQAAVDDRDPAGLVGEDREIPDHEGRHEPSTDDPDEPMADQETEHQRPPNASIASWIRASGRSLVITTLTKSARADGQMTTVWVRSPVSVSSR